MIAKLEEKRCIVFGANGYIGRHLVHFLLQAKNDVLAFDVQDKQLNPIINYEVTDISDSMSLQGIDWNVDFVFIFAGITGTYDGFDSYGKFVKVNEIGLLNILNGIRKSNFRPRIVFPSTRLVYKGSAKALKEDDVKDPKTIYAINKLACESYLEAYKNSFDISYTTYRICVPYGNIFGSDYSYGTVGAFISQAKNNSIIKLYGDGSLRRTFSHVKDICQQIIFSCSDEKARNQIFNASGEDFSLKEVATIIAEKYNAKLNFTEWAEKDLYIESGNTVFDASKLQKICQISIDNGIIDWVKKIVL